METGMKHICLAVDKDEIETIIERLRKAGAEFLSENPKFSNFRDLNRIHIQLRPA